VDDHSDRVRIFIENSDPTEMQTEHSCDPTNDINEEWVLNLREKFLADGRINFCSPDYGETLLHAAVTKEYNRLIKTLLMFGADPCIL